MGGILASRRMVVSKARNDGLSSTGIERRAYSTARIGRAAKESHRADAPHWRELRLPPPHDSQARRHRAHQSVAQEDSEERPDQRRRHFLADRFRRPADGLPGGDAAT